MVNSVFKVEPKTQDVGVQSGLVGLSELSYTKRKQIHFEEQAISRWPQSRCGHRERTSLLFFVVGIVLSIISDEEIHVWNLLEGVTQPHRFFLFSHVLF